MIELLSHATSLFWWGVGYAGLTCRNHVIKKIIFASFFLTTYAEAKTSSQNILLQEFESAHRYSDIIQFSFSILRDQDCGEECRLTWLNNLARASLLMGDNESAKYYLGLNRKINSTNNRDSLHLLVYQAVLSSDYPLYNKLYEQIQDEQQKSKSFVLRWAFAVDRNSPEAIEKTVGVLALQPQFKQLSAKYKEVKRYSPWTAGGMSAILPGAGHAYLGMWQSAALSFLLTSVSGWTTYELYQDQKYASATAASLITSVFYLGSVLSAGRSANEINDRNYVQLRNEIRNWAIPELRFQWDLN